MAYLHENREEFATAVNLASEQFHVLPAIAEKDYYVTMILGKLAEKLPFIVFKGGTSLSKCHKAIKRFSEDIDVTIDTKLSQGQMGKVKDAVKQTAAELGMVIPNIDETRSRRSYNRYLLAYTSVSGMADESVSPAVVLETSFAEVSFPTVVLPVYSYIGDMMKTEAPEAIETYGLAPFPMKVQGIDRTLIDKVFAICDYHMKGEVTRHSRHIYDIYKLLPLVPQNDDFKNLVSEVRRVRAENEKLCPSAQPGVDVPALLRELADRHVYKPDYESITSRILEESIPYEDAITAVEEIAGSGMFEQ